MKNSKMFQQNTSTKIKASTGYICTAPGPTSVSHFSLLNSKDYNIQYKINIHCGYLSHDG